MTRLGGPGGRDPRQWVPRHRHLTLLREEIASLRHDGFLLESTVEPIADANAGDLLILDGALMCEPGLIVEVTEALEMAGDRVRLVSYRCHAAFAEPHRPIFRHDIAHPHRGHPDAHHKHLFDPADPAWPGEIVWVGTARQPTLAEVVVEVRGWWERTGRDLPTA